MVEKLNYHKYYGPLLKEYIKEKYNEKLFYNKNYFNDIFIYEDSKKEIILYKKYIIYEFNKKNSNNNIIDFNDLFKEIKNMIINKKIKISIYYINFIVDNKIDLNIINNKIIDYQLIFFIDNDNIIFEIKNNLFYSCLLQKINNDINIILDKYNQIKNNMTHIYCEISCSYNGFLENYLEIETIKKEFYKNNFWLDFKRVIDKQLYDIKCTYDDIFYNYNILIFDATTWNEKYKLFINEYSNILNNKLIIIIPYKYDVDTVYNEEMLDYCLDLNIVFGLTNCNSISNILNNSDKFMILENYYCGTYAYLLTVITWSSYYKSKFNKFKNIPLLKYDFNSDNILDKNTFLKINNLDINKKIATIILSWPADHNSPSKFNELILMQNENFLVNLNNSLLKLGYNMIIKLHPFSGMKIKNNKIYFNNDNDKQMIEKRTYINFNEIYKYINKFCVIDNIYNNEVYKYTDFNIILSSCTVGFWGYIYKIPSLIISQNIKYNYNIKKSKLIDTFLRNMKNNNLLLNKKICWVLLHTIYCMYSIIKNFFENNYNIKKKKNPDNIFSKVINSIIDLYLNNDAKFLVNIIDNYYDFIINLTKKSYYGDIKYLNDNHSNLYDILEEFINEEHKFNDLAKIIYGNTHNITSNGYFDIINKIIIDKYKNNNKQIKLFISKYIIYDSNNINLINDNNIFEIEISNKPTKSYGINFYINSFEENIKLSLSFECKCKIIENMYIKIYTGKEWITMDEKIDNNYKKISITTTFNLNSRSKWRISSTSLTINQKISFKNIKIEKQP